MKRKAIQLANQTLVVSLPSKWVKEQKIKKGDEINIEERGNELLIGSNPIPENKKKIKLNVSGINKSLYRIIGALYKAGYSEIEFIYDSPKELEIIQKTIRRSLTGFEIIESSKDSVIVKEISRLETDEFEKILKKCFQSLISTGEESIENIKLKNSKELEKLALMDDTINRYCDFCRRVINKDPSQSKKAGLYYIIEELEKIGDIYRDLCRNIAKKPFIPEKNILDLYHEINTFFSDFYELYYKFDLEKVEKFALKKERISEKLKRCIEKQDKREAMLLFYLYDLSQTIFEMNGSLLTVLL